MKYFPDIIITDILMPNMDGLELMAKIRENGLKSSIIVISGYDEFDYVRTALNNEASAYILKPIENEKLLDTVKKVGNKIKKEKSTGQYFEKLKNELSYIKKQFLKDLVLGEIIDKTEIESKISFMDIPLDVKKNYVLDIRIDEYDLVLKQLGTENVKNFKMSVIQLISEILLLNSNFIGIVVEIAPDEWVIIIHPYKDESIIEIIKTQCFELTEKLKGEYRQTVSIGISDMCEDISNLNKAYIQATVAVKQKLLPGLSSVSCTEDEDIINCRNEIKEAIKYIKDNYFKDNVTVECAAKELYISPYYLMHMFKSELGKTFNDCLIECRIDVAKKLLKDRKHKINEIVGMVGYSDIKYFGQLFKKVTGLTPTEYIRKDN